MVSFFSSFVCGAIAFVCVAFTPPAVAAGSAVASLADVPFAPDPRFGLTSRRDTMVGGVSIGATAVAELVAGGDVVYGGVVNGRIVLQRITPTGQGGVWPASTNTNAANIILTPPEGVGYRDVSDIKVFGSRVFVLADRQRSTTVATNDVYVLVLDLDGTLRSTYLAMGEFRDEHGAGLVIYQTIGIGTPTTTWVSVIGHRVLDAVESNPFLTRARLDGDALIRDTSIGDASGYVQVPVPGGLCVPYDEACSMEVAKVVVKPTGLYGAEPVVYVAGSIRKAGNNWDFGLLCVSAGGTPCGGFGNGGFVRRAFDDGGSLADRASGIAVRRYGSFGAYSYTVYVTGNVARRCESGMGATAFNGADGSVELGFGSAGRTLVGGHNGGSGGTAVCFLNDGPDIVSDAAYSGGYLFMGGERVYKDFDGTQHSDVQTLVLDSSGRVVDPLRAHLPISSSPIGALPMESAIRAVATDAAGRFLVGGQSYTPDSPFPSAFVTGRFVEDRIFGNGYE